jgi:hypothetical protein
MMTALLEFSTNILGMWPTSRNIDTSPMCFPSILESLYVIWQSTLSYTEHRHSIFIRNNLLEVEYPYLSILFCIPWGIIKDNIWKVYLFTGDYGFFPTKLEFVESPFMNFIPEYSLEVSLSS